MYSFILLSRIANRVPTAYDAGTRRISPHLTWHDLKSLALQLSPKMACQPRREVRPPSGCTFTSTAGQQAIHMWGQREC